MNFRNCLVTMRPTTKRSELPTRSTVRARINNEFVDFLDSIKTAITNAPGSASVGWDVWTAPHTSDPYCGVIALWIDVDFDHQVWTMRNEVVACRKVLGKHDGENLGRHLLLSLDRVGITSKTGHKVSSHHLSHTVPADAVLARAYHER